MIMEKQEENFGCLRATELLEQQVQEFFAKFVETTGFLPTMSAIGYDREGGGFTYTVEVTKLEIPPRGRLIKK
jgi:hypothetical protein